MEYTADTCVIERTITIRTQSTEPLDMGKSLAQTQAAETVVYDAVSEIRRRLRESADPFLRSLVVSVGN